MNLDEFKASQKDHLYPSGTIFKSLIPNSPNKLPHYFVVLLTANAITQNRYVCACFTSQAGTVENISTSDSKRSLESFVEVDNSMFTIPFLRIEPSFIDCSIPFKQILSIDYGTLVDTEPSVQLMTKLLTETAKSKTLSQAIKSEIGRQIALYST